MDCYNLLNFTINDPHMAFSKISCIILMIDIISNYCCLTDKLKGISYKRDNSP